MTYHERDAWDATGDMGNGIEGQHLKCAKGKWLLDDVEIETGADGLKFCPIMETATVGEVLWHDQKIVERNVGRISDGFLPPTPANIAEKWNPYIAVLGVRCDDGHLGELLTFTSSSWGGWFAFQRLINPWRLKGRAAFPVCTLSTKERHDENRNVDPVFKHAGWSARENFAELLPPPAAGNAAIAYAPEPSKLAKTINDDIPF
ncbi:MAG TPA: hypothetical protein VGP28_06555 [Methylocella sp.]|jgi:hypothetical protein|nr:hypothetical protein [Methylocella sp.]